MRISDWSSDVCSSDLHARRERRNMRENEGELEQPPVGVATAAIMREGLVRVQPGAPGRCLPAQGGAAVRIAFVRRRRTGIAGCDAEVDPTRPEERRVGTGGDSPGGYRGWQ